MNTIITKSALRKNMRLALKSIATSLGKDIVDMTAEELNWAFAGTGDQQGLMDKFFRPDNWKGTREEYNAFFEEVFSAELAKSIHSLPVATSNNEKVAEVVAEQIVQPAQAGEVTAGELTVNRSGQIQPMKKVAELDALLKAGIRILHKKNAAQLVSVVVDKQDGESEIAVCTYNNNKTGKIFMHLAPRFLTIEQPKDQAGEMQVCELQMTYSNPIPKEKRVKVHRSQDAYEYLKNCWSPNINLLEEFVVLFLNRSSEIVGHYLVGKGGMNACIVDPRIVFSAALTAMANGIILSHNHPSGQIKPSDNDIRLTRKLKEGAMILDISLLDHIILGDNTYFSFADEGLL